MRAEAAQQQHMATNELLTQVHTLGGDAQTRCGGCGRPGGLGQAWQCFDVMSTDLFCRLVLQ